MNNTVITINSDILTNKNITETEKASFKLFKLSRYCYFSSKKNRLGSEIKGLLPQCCYAKNKKELDNHIIALKELGILTFEKIEFTDANINDPSIISNIKMVPSAFIRFESGIKTIEEFEEIFIFKQKQSLSNSTLISILFLAADPHDASRLRLGEEFREIKEKLKLANYRDRFKLELPQLAIRPADISQVLLDTQPYIVHFSGHGTSTGELCFENQIGKVHPVQPDALAALFEQFSNHVKCVVLNACFSDLQAKAIAEHIENVIGMNQEIGDAAAIAFAIGFYQGIGAGRTIDEAYKLGCVQIRLHGISEYLTPILIKKK